MDKSWLLEIPHTKFEEWAKSWPVSFLSSSQEHRRGVNA